MEAILYTLGIVYLVSNFVAAVLYAQKAFFWVETVDLLVYPQIISWCKGHKFGVVGTGWVVLLFTLTFLPAIILWFATLLLSMIVLFLIATVVSIFISKPLE